LLAVGFGQDERLLGLTARLGQLWLSAMTICFSACFFWPAAGRPRLRFRRFEPSRGRIGQAGLHIGLGLGLGQLAALVGRLPLPLVGSSCSIESCRWRSCSRSDSILPSFLGVSGLPMSTSTHSMSNSWNSAAHLRAGLGLNQVAVVQQLQHRLFMGDVAEIRTSAAGRASA
jgi:hypothetical protein